MSNPMVEFNKKVIAEFRSSGGKVGGQFAGAPMIIITHTGAKSGKTYTSPLVYSKDRDRFVIVASKGGAPRNPSWYHNLLAHPEVTVEIGTEKFKARATEAKGAARDRLFAAQARLMPQFNEYQKKTDRRIPLLILERVK